MKKSLSLLMPAIMSVFSFGTAHAQIPNLGAASGFAIFTSAGAINNTGPTIINGGLGTHAGALNGFPPGIVNGETHVADAVTAQAMLSLDAAFIYMNGLTCGTVLGVGMGNGQTLTPGLYCTGAASTLNGNLTLDGQGNPNALFVINIGGAFATGNLSTVTLINGATTCNTYWIVNGQSDYGVNSTFRGVLLGDGAAILASGSTLDGKVLLRSGAVTLDNNQATACTQVNFPLPIHFVSFDAYVNHTNDGVDMEWQTTQAVNTDHFNIERSMDGVKFQSIGSIASTDNLNEMLSYNFKDVHPAMGMNYYRVAEVDLDGRKSFTAVKNVLITVINTSTTVYPNPFTTSFTLYDALANTTKVHHLKLYDLMGGQLHEKIITDAETIVDMGHLPAGLYYYTLQDGEQIISSGTLLSNR